MKIADLDLPTRKLIYSATLMARFPSNRALRKLKQVVHEFEEAHVAEMAMNLARAIWPEEKK